MHQIIQHLIAKHITQLLSRHYALVGIRMFSKSGHKIFCLPFGIFMNYSSRAFSMSQIELSKQYSIFFR
jgi:hypothetical protein